MQTANMTAHLGRGLVLEITGAFRINGTSDPDNHRDGNSGFIESVDRESPGLFTVTLSEGCGTLPDDMLIKEWAGISQSATPTVWSRAHVVKDSYSKADRTFQIQVLKATATADTADAASDADDNDVVFFELKGSIDSIGTDDVE
jgi:hypothetical protein